MDYSLLPHPNTFTLASNVMLIVREIQASGRTTLQAIANALNARKVATARGGEWWPSNVRALLARPAVNRAA